jgi:hypothetical protein
MNTLVERILDISRNGGQINCRFYRYTNLIHEKKRKQIKKKRKVSLNKIKTNIERVK